MEKLTQEETEALYELLADFRTFNNDEEAFVRLIEALLNDRLSEQMNKIKARLTIEVMEGELQKNKSLYTDGHIHGVRRAIYLLDHLTDDYEDLKCLICNKTLGLRPNDGNIHRACNEI